MHKFEVAIAMEAGSALVQPTPAQRRRSSGERGSSLVEYALTLVISFVLLFAIIDFGRALYSYHFVSYAAREAARYASVRGANSCGYTVSPCSIDQAQLLDYIQQITPAGIDVNLVTLPNDPWATSTNNPNNLPVCTNIHNYPGCAVQVQVGYTFNYIFPYNFYNSAPVSFQATSINMISTSQMIITR